MHHCFFAHSFITYLVGRLVANQLGLSREDQTIICARGFIPNPSDEDICIHTKLDTAGEDFPSYLKFYKGRKKMKAFDALLNGRIHGRPFKFYTFSKWHRYNQIVFGMKNCLGEAILEEGLNSYGSVKYNAKYLKFPISRYARFWNALNYDHRIRRRGFVDLDSEFYCLFENCFPDAIHKHLVLDSDVAIKICSEQALEIPENAVILVHEWGYGYNWKHLRQYTSLIMHLIEKQRVKSLYHKYHPVHTKEAMEYFSATLAKAGISAIELPKSVPLEYYAFNPKPYKFLGLNSSVLHYARMFQKEVHTVFDFEWGTLLPSTDELLLESGCLFN
jgi:hypothetical protein